ncbi:MAG TPA: hypothetical protein VHA33_03880 [Candidatus Angelobacter sp.]|nr:hypothetical protein [Candidatus Angelobacter sp.]
MTAKPTHCKGREGRKGSQEHEGNQGSPRINATQRSHNQEQNRPTETREHGEDQANPPQSTQKPQRGIWLVEADLEFARKKHDFKAHCSREERGSKISIYHRFSLTPLILEKKNKPGSSEKSLFVNDYETQVSIRAARKPRFKLFGEEKCFVALQLC